jgi:DNA mismatch endonuclease, patch repair protein
VKWSLIGTVSRNLNRTLPLVDIVTPAKRSEMMAGIRNKNTKPEILVRKILHAAGFRFRLHAKLLPGKPDIILPKHKTAIFVQGCFWHGHDDCPIFRLPKSRTEFWAEKIGTNRLRDTAVKSLLIQQGWKVVYVWECAVKGSKKLAVAALSERLTAAISDSLIPFVEIRGKLVQPD